MWKWLHPYAKPERAYRLAGQLLPWLGWPAWGGLLLGLTWGLAFAPPDYQQGDAFRIIYLHVPAALLSMGTYLGMAIAALVGLVWQQRQAELMMMAMAPVGAVFTFIALVTGAAWGKPMWGTWWVWDARLTSELILLFLYLGVLALHGAIADARVAGRAAALLALVGVINLPIIHYSVVWWNTLHQGASLTRFAKPAISSAMLWPLLVMIVAFALLLAWFSLLRFRTALLRQEWHRPWVHSLLQEER